MDAVDYLGHVIRPGRLEVAEKNTAALKETMFRKTQTELKSFLGLCNVYRRFDAPFAAISALLTALLRNDTPFNLPSFTEEQKKRLTHYVRSCCRPRSWHFLVRRVNIFSISMPPRRNWVAVYDRCSRMVQLSHWGIGRTL
jgi:hypothetical protein